MTRLGATSTAASLAVAARHSRRPVISERVAAGDDPVPGLLKARNVVVPPNAAATESSKKRSGRSSVATRVCVWTSTTPGSTSSPVASTTSRADAASPPRSGSTAAIRPPSTATSARAGAVRRDDDAAPDEEVGHAATPASTDLDLLGAFPQAPPPDLAEAIRPALVRLDRREVVRRQLADLRRRGAGPVREEDLALADPARVERELARGRVRRVVLPADVGPQVAVRDPGRLAAPAAVDEPCAQGQEGADGRDRAAAPRAPSGR